MIGWELVNRDIEMIKLTHLSDERANFRDLENREELAKTLLYGLEPIGLICNAKVKSEFSHELQFRDMIMMILNLPSRRNFSLLHLSILRIIPPAPAI